MTHKEMPLVDRTPHRVCWSCEHLFFSPGSRSYSEWTPGDEFEMYCTRMYWEFRNHKDYLAEFRDKLMSAEVCGDFKERQR